MKRLAPLLLGGFLAAGCVTRQDIRGIQSDLFNIQQGIEKKIGSVEDQTTSVQTTQADFRMDMQELSQSIAALTAELQDNRTRMVELSTRLDDLEANFKERLDTQIELLSGSKFVEKPLPSNVYNLANSDFSRGKYSDAMKGFQTYIAKFPKGENVPEATMKIGDCHAKLGNSEAAIGTYDDLVKSFPSNRLVPTALLRKAKIYESMGKTSLAKDTYGAVVKKYNGFPESKTAQDRLHALQSPSKQ